MRTRSLTVAALALTLTAAFAACAPTPVPAGQSVKEACTVLSDGMTDVQSALADAQTSLSDTGDLTGAVESMTVMERELDELAPEITNAEVRSALREFRSGVSALAEALRNTDDVEDLVANDEFAQVAESIQSASMRFAELCN